MFACCLLARSIQLKAPSDKASFSIVTFLYELLRVLANTGKEHLLYRLLSISDLLLFIDAQLLCRESADNATFGHCILEIFQRVYNFYPSQSREYVVKGGGNSGGKSSTTVPILSSIVTILVSTNDLGLQWTSYQCLKTILGSSAPELIEYDEFLSKIYSSTLFSHLFEPLCTSCGDKASELHFILLQLLSLLVSTQGYRFKYLLLNSAILNEGVSKYLMVRGDATIENKKALLGALSILRQMVGLGDEFYNRLLVKFGRSLLDPLVDILELLSKKNDLLCSTLIDLFDEMGCRTDNLFLQSYFNRRFYKRFMSLAACVPFFGKTIFFSNLKDESGDSDQEDDEKNTFASDYDPEEGFLPLNIQEKKDIDDIDPVWTRSIEPSCKRAVPTFRFVNMSPPSKANSCKAASSEASLDENNLSSQMSTPPLSQASVVDACDLSHSAFFESDESADLNTDGAAETGNLTSVESSSSVVLSPPKKIKFVDT